jgi:hypothetical protein
MNLRCYVSILLLVCGAVVGCANQEPAGIPVSGTVTFQGKPLDQGAIEFSPTSQQGTFSGGEIVDGQYSIPAEQGLAPGSYDVRITSSEGGTQAPADQAPGESTITAKERIPAAYNSATTLKVDVTKDGNKTFDFQIP